MIKYLVILLPSKEVDLYIKSLREEFNLKYSHTIEPHLTLIPPFSARADLKPILKKIASQTNPFGISLEQVKSFPRPRKITYLSVSDPKPATSLRSKLAKELKMFGPFPEEFIPHITLAKEVDNELFDKIQQRLSQDKKKLEFGVSSFFLFKKEGPSQIWEQVSNFPFRMGYN